MRATIALALILIAAGSFAAEQKLTMEDMRTRPWVEQGPMPSAERLKLVELLETHTGKYLSAVQDVNLDSFSSVTAPGPIVASLVGEVEDVKTLMRENLLLLKVLKHYPEADREWVLLARNFYAVLPYIEDLERFKLVTNTDYVGVRLLMTAAFDRILIPEAKPLP